MKKRKAVIIFVKFPEKGKVKTRLASITTENFAVGIYKIIAGHIFNQVELLNTEVDVFVFYAPIDEAVKIKNWVGKEFLYRVQCGNTLGEKMANAFEEVFAKDYSKVLIIGSDVPEISREVLMESFNQLESCDIVIAPADDGGYSLFGMNKPNTFLFKNIAWSTNTVLSETEKIIRENCLKLITIDTLNDIDTFGELVEWLQYSKNKIMIDNVKILAEKENISI